MRSSLKRSKPGGSVPTNRKSVRWSEALEKALWFYEDDPPSDTKDSFKPAGSTLKFSALSKSKRVEKLGGAENLFNLPISSKKMNFSVDVPGPDSVASSITVSTKPAFSAAAPLVASNPTVVMTTDWKEAVDAASNETYYYHAKTNATTWDMPLEFKRYKEYIANKDKIAAAKKAKFAAKLRESKGEGLLLKQMKGKMALEEDDDDKAADAPFQVPPHLKRPEEKKKHQTMLLAARKFKESSQFEFILKLKQADNPEFAFLNEGNEYQPYYEWLKEGDNEARVSTQLKEEERKQQENEEQVHKGPVGLLGAAYSSEEDSDGDDDVGCGVLVPPAAVKETIKTMIAFVLKNGLPFEETVRERERQRATVKFIFLQKDSPYYPYYVKERDAAIKARDDAGLQNEVNEKTQGFHQAYISLYEGCDPRLDDRQPPDQSKDHGIWDRYVKAKAAEAAALVAARGGALMPTASHTIADTTQSTPAQFESEICILDRMNSAVEGIKKRSRQSNSDGEAQKKSINDNSLSKEEKDELRKKRLKRAKMMSGHLKLKMMETKDQAEKRKQEELKTADKKVPTSSAGLSSENEEDSRRDRDRDRDWRHERKHHDRDRDRDRRRDRDRDNDRDRDRGRSRRGERDRKHKSSKRSKRSRSRSRSRS